jgi:hypothetical protein
MSMAIRNVYINILMEKENHREDAAFEGCQMKNIITLDVSDQWIRPMLKQ